MPGLAAMSARGDTAAEGWLRRSAGDAVVGIAAVLRVGGTGLVYGERSLLCGGGRRVCPVLAIEEQYECDVASTCEELEGGGI